MVRLVCGFSIHSADEIFEADRTHKQRPASVQDQSGAFSLPFICVRGIRPQSGFRMARTGPAHWSQSVQYQRSRNSA